MKHTPTGLALELTPEDFKGKIPVAGRVRDELNQLWIRRKDGTRIHINFGHRCIEFITWTHRKNVDKVTKTTRFHGKGKEIGISYKDIMS